MSRTDILCVGRLKERYWTEAVAEYSKRLSAYTDLRILEVKDEKAPEKASEAEAKAGIIRASTVTRIRAMLRIFFIVCFCPFSCQYRASPEAACAASGE